MQKPKETIEEYQIPSSQRDKIDEDVAKIIEAILKENQIRLWDFKVNGNSFYFVLDKADGLSSDQLEATHKQLYRALEAALPLDSLGTIECVTPGVVRELISPNHFEWSNNYKVKISFMDEVDSEKSKAVEGTLTIKDNEYFIDDKKIDKNKIKKAETIFDFKSVLSKGKSEIKKAKRAKKADRATKSKNKQKKVKDKK